MADRLTVGEITAIHAIVLTHGPPDSRDRLCARLTEQLPRFITHHITCTTGCTSASECTQPGEQPCPCHAQDQEEQ